MKYIKIPSRRMMIAWAIMFGVMFLSTARHTYGIPVTGYGGNGGIYATRTGCGWTDVAASRQAINLGYGFAAVGAALWFIPGFAIGGLIIGGISGGMDIAMTMNGC